MKTKNNHFCKIFYGITFLTTLLTMPACKDKDETKPEATLAETGVKGPSIDINTAVITGNMEVLRHYIAIGSNLNEKYQLNGSSPLINASLLGNTEMAKTLIDAGADLNAQDNEGFTPLITASFFCHPEIVRLLLYSHADKTIKNKNGQTAYQVVYAPFANVRSDYDRSVKMYEPIGLKLDYGYIEKTRPVMEAMLKYD